MHEKLSFSRQRALTTSLRDGSLWHYVMNMRTHVTHFQGKTNPLLWSHPQQEENCRWYSFVYSFLKEHYAWVPLFTKRFHLTHQPPLLAPLHPTPWHDQRPLGFEWLIGPKEYEQHDGHDVNGAKDPYKRAVAFILSFTNATVYKTHKLDNPLYDWSRQWQPPKEVNSTSNKWYMSKRAQTRWRRL